MFTEAELIESVRAVAAAHPQHVYRVPEGASALTAFCRYTPDEPNPLGCGINAGLVRLGVPQDVISELDGPCIGDSAWGSADVKEILGDYLHYDALVSHWISTFQGAQDAGRSWSEAVEKADQRHM